MKTYKRNERIIKDIDKAIEDLSNMLLIMKGKRRMYSVYQMLTRGVIENIREGIETGKSWKEDIEFRQGILKKERKCKN